MKHAHFEEMAIEAVLGTLDKVQLSELNSHLQGCSSCQAYLDSASDLARRLPMAVEPLEPRPEIGKQLLDAIHSRHPRPSVSKPPFFLLRWKPAMAVALSAALVLAAIFHLKKINPVGPHAIVSLVRGTILVDGKPALQGAIVLPGQVISSSPGAQARVHIGDKAVFWIKENSVVRLVNLDEPVLLGLDKGWMLQVVKHGVSYSVKTPLGSAHAHGTVFFAMVESPEEVYFCICRDQLDIDAEGIHRSVASQHHAGMELSTETGKLRFELVKPEAHTDADVASLQAELP